MAPLLGSESTSFTLDNMGRFLCNTLQEALNSATEIVGGRKRDFDLIVIGGGTFGSVVAEHLFIADVARSRRILVLEAGPFVLPEHVQNMPYMGGAPDTRAPWTSHPALSYPGLIFAIGGRSLTWGGWSPELLDIELAQWPAATRAALRATYFADASRQIGVKETNDFIYGPLHTALRKQLFDGLNTAGNETGITFAQLLDHPAVRYPDPGEPPIDAALLRDWLHLPPTDTTPLLQLKNLFKLEAPLAVQSVTLPGLFPTNKFSAVPGVTRASRLASSEADGAGQAADARKRLMIVPDCHVQELITETQADNWVRVTGVRVWQNGSSRDIMLAPPRNGRQSAAVIALGTVEVNLTPTQPHQYRGGINREPIICKINHHTQPGQFPIAHLNHPRHHTSPRTFRRQYASVTFLSGTCVTFLSGAYTEWRYRLHYGAETGHWTADRPKRVRKAKTRHSGFSTDRCS